MPGIFISKITPTYPPVYIERIKHRYRPGTVQYKRKVNGLWVVAEGIIYDRFVETQHVINNPIDYDYYVLSCV